ncbi:metallophosphoesterase family protein [Brevibacterium sp. 50QC2O2]|uniref:metallophosphoesterase n=1 Tax=Brevibacterium TaxID=1696 RepID=UPI00211C9C49|nr:MULTISPECIES: metallophosphoesterase [unclassified Brevibacterium]MCQ9384680.1 metallophosphoesterase family protein [Brevibacterium sp. 68QC2CO]MCQ9389266.1 metallophosphoesterase family protein [Brevibacterium sp. 50QC2O2]
MTVSEAALDLSTVDFVTSDTHFGHARIIELCGRPFSSVQEMNGELIRRWNNVVGPDATVLHLGDLALGERERSIGLTAALNGRKLIVPGNHDVFWSHYRASAKYKALNAELLEHAGWQLLTEEVTAALDGREVVISHFPYAGDSHGEDRYAKLRPTDTGLPLIHGHTHDIDHGPQGNSFHVGVDAHDFEPMPMSEISQWLAQMS